MVKRGFKIVLFGTPRFQTGGQIAVVSAGLEMLRRRSEIKSSCLLKAYNYLAK